MEDIPLEALHLLNMKILEEYSLAEIMGSALPLEVLQGDDANLSDDGSILWAAQCFRDNKMTERCFLQLCVLYGLRKRLVGETERRLAIDGLSGAQRCAINTALDSSVLDNILRDNVVPLPQVVDTIVSLARAKHRDGALAIAETELEKCLAAVVDAKLR